MLGMGVPQRGKQGQALAWVPVVTRMIVAVAAVTSRLAAAALS